MLHLVLETQVSCFGTYIQLTSNILQMLIFHIMETKAGLCIFIVKYTRILNTVVR